MTEEEQEIFRKYNLNEIHIRWGRMKRAIEKEREYLAEK